MGICGVLAVLNLVTSTGNVWHLLGSTYEYADCSSFTEAQLSGVAHLQTFVCLDYPRAMVCNADAETPGISAPDAHSYNTGLASTSDPLLADFIRAMRLFKVGLFIFFVSALVAILSAEPELESTRLSHNQLAAASGTWSKAHLALAGVSLIAALLLSIGGHGMLYLDSGDVLYGDGVGGAPPLGPLRSCESF